MLTETNQKYIYTLLAHTPEIPAHLQEDERRRMKVKRMKVKKKKRKAKNLEEEEEEDSEKDEGKWGDEEDAED